MWTTGVHQREHELTLAKLQGILLETGKNTANILKSPSFGDLCKVMKGRCDTEHSCNFRKVVDEHPEWLLKIIDVAVKLVDISKDSQNTEWLPADPYVLVANICNGVQETAQALSNLKVHRWEPGPDVGQYSPLQDDASRKSLIQAICQGAGAWTPAGALMVGLHMALYTMGVKADLDAPTGSSESPSEEGGSSVAAIQEGIGMVEGLGKLRREFEVGAGAKVAGTGANVKLKFTENPWFMAKLEKAGLSILSEWFERRNGNGKLSSMPVSNRKECPPRDIVVGNRHFLASNTGMCAVYFKHSHALEVYQWMKPTRHHGMLELVCYFNDVSKLPTWRDTLIQEFTIRNGKLSSLSQDCEGYQAPKKKSGKDMYEPVKLCCEGAEKYVEEVLVSSNLKGGCWNTIMYGRPPTTSPDIETGFRTAPMCVAVAGMAIWFPSTCRKMAAWIDFPNVPLRDNRSLTLGTCDVKAEYAGRPGEKEEQVAFVAGKDSRIWQTKVMFG